MLNQSFTLTPKNHGQSPFALYLPMRAIACVVRQDRWQRMPKSPQLPPVTDATVTYAETGFTALWEKPCF